MFDLKQNQLVGFDGSMPDSAVTASNTIFATRADAGLPTTASELPAPAGCADFEWVFEK